MPTSNKANELKLEKDPAELIRLVAQEERFEIKQGDTRSVEERDGLEIAKLHETIKEMRAEHRRNRLTYKFQTEYIPKLFDLTYQWVIFIAVVLILNSLSVGGFNNPDCHIGCVNFKLSDNALIALLTTTTVTIVGLFYSVVKWLYPNQAKKDDKH